MKIYTKTGDDGTTGLFGGARVPKDCLRVEAYGDVDELNSVLGLAAAACRHAELSAILTTLQNRLFELGSDLAAPPDAKNVPFRMGVQHITESEGMIDAMWAPLEPMKSFVLPGGSELAAILHVARTVCRRAERHVIALGRHEPIGDHAVIYLNRVSDLLFAMARRANQLEGVADVPWAGRAGKQVS